MTAISQASSRRTFRRRYQDRFKPTWVVLTILCVIGSLAQRGAGDSITLLFSPSAAAAIGWGLLLAVQMLWAALLALPINLIVAAFPDRKS